MTCGSPLLQRSSQGILELSQVITEGSRVASSGYSKLLFIPFTDGSGTAGTQMHRDAGVPKKDLQIS